MPSFFSMLARHWRFAILLLVVVFAVLIRGSSALLSFFSPVPPREVPHYATLTIGTTSVPVLVADTPQLTYRGLSGVTSLDPARGMLFVFPTMATRTFVMRDMRFPLDFVWVSDGYISDLVYNAPLEIGVQEESLTRYTGRYPVDMVLEVPSGTVRSIGWRVGDSVRVQY